MVFASSWLSFMDKGIGGLLNIIWSILCIPVYAMIRNLFNIFIKIAELDIVSNVNINEIYKRVTMIITIVMTFYVAFSVVKYTINPETVSDKEKGAGKIAYRIIVAILLVAFVPNIFSMAYDLQNRLIKTQIFSKVILGEQAWDYSSYGSSFAADTFSAFYRVDEKNCEDNCEKANQHVATVIEGVRQGGSTINIVETIVLQWMPGVEFDGLLALIFGCFVVYVIFLYCIDVAIRCVQLLFLQVIAPVAIMTYIVPSKDNMFNKWLKQCTTTYLDLFIRIAILYFAMLVINVLGHSLKIYEVTSNGHHIGPITYIFFIMGILIFVQRAPKLLAELFPQGGAASIGYGFEWKTRGEPLKKTIDTFKRPVAATAGAVASTAATIKSIRKGNLKDALDKKYKDNTFMKTAASTFDVVKSAYKGGQEAAKQNSILGAVTNRRKQSEVAEKMYADGGAPIERALRGQHYENEKERFKQFLDGLDEILKGRKETKDSLAETKTVKTSKSYMEDWDVKGLGNPSARVKFGKDIEKIVDKYASSNREEQDKQTASREIREALLATNIYTDQTRVQNALHNIINQTTNADNTIDTNQLNTQAQDYINDLLNSRVIDANTHANFRARIDNAINSYTNSAKTDQDKQTAEQAIRDAIVSTNVYVDQPKLQDAYNTFVEQFNKDDESGMELDIIKENTKTYNDTVKATKDMYGSTYGFYDKDGKTPYRFKVKDRSGRKVEKTVAEMTADEVRQAAGDIETLVKETIQRTKNSDEYAAAQANANAPGKKEGS